MKGLLRRAFGPVAPVGTLLREAFSAAWAHNISRMAASIAFFGAFSLAPMIVIMVSLASLVFGKSATEGLIDERLASTFGQQTAKFIQSMLAGIYSSRGLTLATVLAIVALVWASTRIIGSVRGALNDVWGVQGHGGRGFVGFVVGKLIDLGMVIGIGFMFIASMLANTAVTALTTYFSRLLPLPGWLLQVFGVLFSLVVTTVFLTILFRVLPNIKVRLVHILVGASMTAVLFSIGNFVIGRYLGRTSPGSAFGAAGSLAVIMVWIYYVAYIIIFGAEVTRAYAHRASMRRFEAAATEAAADEEADEAAAAEAAAAAAEAAGAVAAAAEAAADEAKAVEAPSAAERPASRDSETPAAPEPSLGADDSHPS
jgi:membrane protein